MHEFVKKDFITDLDADSAEHRVPPTSYISGQNFRVGVSEKNGFGYVENILKNAEKFHVLPSGGVNTRIGFASDDANGWIAKFNQNSIGDDGIYLFDVLSETWYTMLLDADVTGGLNFQRNELIHSTRIENGCLYWCNGKINEPRRIDIKAAVRMYHPTAFVTDVVVNGIIFTTFFTHFLAPNSIIVAASFFGTVNIRDIINISGTGLNDGNYTILNKVVVGAFCTLTVAEPVIDETLVSLITYRSALGDGIIPYTSPVAQSVLYWIRRQPGLPLAIEKMSASVYVNNFIKNEATQYCYRYIYRNYEPSTLSGLSLIANYNKKDDDFNFVNIEIPLGETIEQDVLQIDLVVKYLSTGKYFIIKSWNKLVADDLAAIDAHNLGTNLFYDFANDFIGIALSDAYSVKPYDSLPIYAQTIEIARNRAHMANYVIGYNTPIASSLTAAAQISDDATLTGRWVKIDYATSAHHYFLDLGSLGFFDAAIQPVPPPYPSTYAYGSMTLVAVGPASFAAYIISSGLYPLWTGGIQYPGDSATITGGPPVPGVSGDVCYKSGASYQVSVSFLDHAGRKTGIRVAPELKVNNPERSYDQVEFMTGINWSLSNANAVDEIPTSAYYVSINVSKCLTTRFFLQARGKNITYATKDINGDYVFNTTAFTEDLNGVAIDFTSLNAFGMGYNFTEGDLVKVYIDADPEVYNLSTITSVDGKWIVCELQDLGVLGNTAGPKTDFLFEIYTPYRPSSSEPGYEMSQIYKITNPGTLSREYSTLAGTITGDVTLLTRNDGTDDYLTENMSPNDKFYTIWNTDAGRPNFIDTIGQQEITNLDSYSNTLIQGTKTNGLSSFEALNVKDIPLECGAIIKLIVADKITEQGNVMLLICQNETVSAYLGEVQLLGTSQNAFVAQSADVIGTINILQGSYGTLNPESVVQYNGKVFFYSLIKGCFVRYSNNGLFPISDYGLQRVSHLFSQKYGSLSQEQIEALGSRPFVFGGIDPYFEEVFWAIPTTETTPPKGYLPDYVSPDLPIIYPYDIYDGIGKVLVFNTRKEKWQAPHSYQTEGFIDVRDYLFSAKDGAMYKHNVDDGTDETYNEWYNEEVKTNIGLIINEVPNIIKEFLTLSIEGNIQPSFTHTRTETPNIQSSHIISAWTLREGVFYGAIKRDRLSPNATGTYDQKMIKGAKMRGNWLKVFVEFDTRELLQLRYINCGFVKSKGGTT